MRILYLLIPMALGVVGVALWAFLWAVRTGQFDDLEGPAYRVLMDNDKVGPDDGKATRAPESKAAGD